MKKIFILLFLTLIVLPFSLADTEITIHSTFNVGGTYGDGSISYDKDNNLFYNLGGSFPTGKLYGFNSTYSLISETNINLFYNYLTVSNDYIYAIQYENIKYDYLIKLYKNGTIIDSVQVIGTNNVYIDDIVSITNDDNYLYLLNQIGELYVYDLDLNYFGKIDICANVGDCPPFSSGNLYSFIAYDYDNNLFYYYNHYSTYFYILDENFNDITNDVYYINLPFDSLRDVTYYNNKLYGGEWENGNGYIFNLPTPPTPPNYHTILNPNDGITYNYSKQYCVDETTYCTDTKYVLNFNSEPQFYCDSYLNTSYCSGGCSTEYDSSTNTFYGVCEQLACVNECTINGFSTCGTSNTYNICGNYDSDACLEYSNDLFCTTNQYCTDTETGAQCVNKSFVELGDTYTQEKINVDISLQKLIVGESEINKDNIDTETVYTANGEQLEITFKTHPVAYLVSKAWDFFSVKSNQETGSATVKVLSTNLVSNEKENYFGVTCDYQEEFVTQDTLNENINSWVTTNGLTTDDNYNYIIVNSSSNATRSLFTTDNNKEIMTIIKPTVDGEYNIYYSSDEGVLSSLTITMNTTTKNVIVKENLYNKILVNDTGKVLFNDIEYLVIQATFNKDIQTINYFISVNRKPLNNILHTDYYSLPIPYDNGYNEQPKSIIFESDEDMYVYQVIEKTFSDYPSYSYGNDVNDMLKSCFIEKGCQEIKAYGNSKAIPTYHFSDKIYFCLNPLTGEITDVDDFNEQQKLDMIEGMFGRPLTSREKLIIGMLLSILPLIFGFWAFRESGEQSVLFTSVILTVGLLIVFVIFGYISGWIMALMLLVGGATATALLKSSVIGRG